MMNINEDQSISGGSKSSWKARFPTQNEFSWAPCEDNQDVVEQSDLLTKTVIRGDTLYSVSKALKRYYNLDVSVEEIARTNNIADPNKIEVGQVLKFWMYKGDDTTSFNDCERQPLKKETTVVQAKPQAPDPAVHYGDGICGDTSAEMSIDPQLSVSTVPANDILANAKLEPSIVNHSRNRGELVALFDSAMKAGDTETALEIARVFQSAVDDTGLEQCVGFYVVLGQYLYQTGNFAKAKTVFEELALAYTKLNKQYRSLPDKSKNNLTIPAILSEQLVNNGNNVYRLMPRKGIKGEEVLFLGGTAIYGAMDIDAGSAAWYMYSQADFMDRAGGTVTNPFDFDQIKTYMATLSPQEIIQQMELYFRGFYFHPRSNIPDNLEAKDVKRFPTDMLGRKPADCRIYSRMAKVFLTDKSWFGFVDKTKYDFQDIYGYKVIGDDPDDSRNVAFAHQIFVATSKDGSGAIMINNDRVTHLDNGDPKSIRLAIVSWLEDQGFSATSNRSITHFSIVNLGNSRANSPKMPIFIPKNN